MPTDSIWPEPLDAGSYYLPLGDNVYQPTHRTQGAWQDWEQHMAPVAGLLAHAMQTHEPRPDLQLSRVTYEILGIIKGAPSTVRCRTLRPGRTIELVEAVFSVEGRDVVRAQGWRLSIQDTSKVAGGFPSMLPDPDTLPPWHPSGMWDGGYIASLEARAAPGNEPGRGQAWIRTPITLIEGEPVSPTAAFILLADTANGVAVRAQPTQWVFPNIDLSIHLYRQPLPGWVGFDTTVVFGEQGVGLTSSVLYDVHGAVGRAEQILTVREVPAEVSP